jgi:hypothetical protein
MAFAGINYVAVIVATIAGFAFGSAYYMVLGKAWMAALGKSEAAIKGAGKKMPVVPMLIALVAQFMMAYLLAGILGHLGLDHLSARNGVITALFVWGGFVVTTMAVNYAFQGQRRTLWLIDALHWLGVLAIQGLVLGLIGL